MGLSEEWREFVPDVTFELIPIKNLVSNQDYQRSLSARQIQKMVENFDLYQINLIKVSRRDGANLVMNGQHTIETVAAKSGSRDTPYGAWYIMTLITNTRRIFSQIKHCIPELYLHMMCL